MAELSGILNKIRDSCGLSSLRKLKIKTFFLRSDSFSFLLSSWSVCVSLVLFISKRITSKDNPKHIILR